MTVHLFLFKFQHNVDDDNGDDDNDDNDDNGDDNDDNDDDNDDDAPIVVAAKKNC